MELEQDICMHQSVSKVKDASMIFLASNYQAEAMPEQSFCWNSNLYLCKAIETD